jgi:tetratricopeptide (TPR) repeat protein
MTQSASTATKIFLRLLSRGVLSLFLLALMSMYVAAQTAVQVPVRISESAERTRLVFDFNRLTGYKVAREGGTVIVTFDTPVILTADKKSARHLGSIEISKPDAETSVVILRLVTGAATKDYRLNRKVVIDVTPSTAVEKQEPAKVATVKPAEPKKVTPPPMPAKKVLPAPKPVEKTDAVPKPAPVTPVESAGLAPPVPVESAIAPADTLPIEPTLISFSTLQPAKLAVFNRDSALWIVIDTALTGAQAPGVTGPDADLLGQPQILKFTGGTAWRYIFPARRFLSVEKRNLTWDIKVSAIRLVPPATEQISIEKDPTSDAVKMIVPVKSGSAVMEFQDPQVGDMINVVASGDPLSRIDQPRRFPDLEVFPATIGFAMKPNVEDLRLTRIQDFVLISSPNNLLATPSSGPIVSLDPEKPDEEGQDRLFDFPNWRQGGLKRLTENRRDLEAKAASARNPQSRSEELMKLALLYFSNGLGPETLGVLRILNDENPSIMKSTNVIALRGAAAVLAHHYDDGLQDLSNPALQNHPEINLWRGYAAAATEQWQKANRYFPPNARLLIEYPDSIARDFTLYMAESALRLGRIDTARKLLDSVPLQGADQDIRYISALSYLRGEALRQEGRMEEAIRLWRPVANSIDRLYHAKASLALTNLELQEKKITLQEAIDHIDSLRFAWRGDGFEIQILNDLGRLRVQNGQHFQGLTDLREAMRLSQELQIDTEPVLSDMRAAFRDIFIGNMGGKINPVEAVSIFNEFKDLLPEGRDNSLAQLNFADFLIQIDLLEKAEEILEGQIDGGFPLPEQMPGIGAKLAAIYLIDNRAEKALSAIARTERPGLANDQDTPRLLLKARALSQLGKTDDAIALLANNTDISAQRLTADVLWRARRWAEAAASIEIMLPPAKPPLEDAGGQMVVNAAVAYKLAGNKAALENLRSRYQAAMSTTALATTFAIVTRDGGASELADRGTILKTAGEVDMFKDFLDSYRAKDTASKAENSNP